MTGIAFADLTAEIEAAARDGSPGRRSRILQQIAALFVADAGRLSPEQLSIFDDVLVRLSQRAEVRILAELSTALAEIVPAPLQTIRRLASHENAAVAVPVLVKSASLSDIDLVEVARNRSQEHLIAISKRERLSEALTEIILKHSGKDASRVLARNPTARFTAQGYAVLLAIAERDDNVAESLGSRSDLPADILQSLLGRTTEIVRARLLKSAPSQVRERVQTAMDSAPVPVVPKTSAANDYAEAKAAIITLNKTGKLNDSSVNRFAIRREYPNVIAALVLLSGATLDIIAPLMDEESGGGLIIACRASRLNWQTTLAVLSNRRVPPLPKEQLDQAREVFEMLYVSAAQYTIRFEPPVSSAAKPGCSDNIALAAGSRR
jgi:uncharacterized protein (DUF2336 family)